MRGRRTLAGDRHDGDGIAWASAGVGRWDRARGSQRLPLALIALGVAVAVELGAYLLPWVDNALDTVATPAAVIAGTLLTALMLGDAPPALQWILAVVAGGGTAGVVQTGTVLTRAASLGTTGGVANPLVGLGEAFLSIALTALSVLVPFLAMGLVVGAGFWWFRRRRATAPA